MIKSTNIGLLKFILKLEWVGEFSPSTPRNHVANERLILPFGGTASGIDLKVKSLVTVAIGDIVARSHSIGPTQYVKPIDITEDLPYTSCGIIIDTRPNETFLMTQSDIINLNSLNYLGFDPNKMLFISHSYRLTDSMPTPVDNQPVWVYVVGRTFSFSNAYFGLQSVIRRNNL